MQEVSKNIYVGSKYDLPKTNDEDYAFVHATKTMFTKKDNEVINEENNHLYLNWVDAKDSKYFDYNDNGVNVLMQVLDFIEKWEKEKKVFIHCDEGVSRSPSIAMVYMAKRNNEITNKDHVFAEREFSHIYPNYFAYSGISDFLFKNWFKIK